MSLTVPAQSETTPSRADLVRRAERFGIAGVWQVALASRLSPLDLAGLALALRRIEPRWRMPRGQQRDELALALVAQGEGTRYVTLVCQMDVRTLRELRERGSQPLDLSAPPTEPCGLPGGES
jgi:hypothetical protein